MMARGIINLTWAEIGMICIGACVMFVAGWTCAAIMVKTVGKPETFDDLYG